MAAAREVFNIPELLELILLSLPCNTIHQELGSIRTIILGQRTCRAWQALVDRSTPIRKRLYYSTPLDATEAHEWNGKHAFPPSNPNPWIPDLLLNQRSWGSSWPFDNIYTHLELRPSQPKFWTFAFELSRAQYSRIPKAGAWRDMLVASPPFTDFWYTRCVYELGSGRAPFVTHLDYDAGLPKTEQRYRAHCPGGATLGDLCDAVAELYDKHPSAKFVMVENLRLRGNVNLSDDRPLTKSYVPGSSAERAHGWH